MKLLAFLHIPERVRLFAACHDLLEPGGTIYIEDFSKVSEPSHAQWQILRDKIYCSSLTTVGVYVQELRAAGFEDIEARDLTTSWKAFTAERAETFQKSYQDHAEIHGHQITDGLSDFYIAVATLYDQGVLGGLRITARKRL